MSIAVMVLWLSNVVVAQTFPWLLDKIEGRVFYILAGTCIAAFIFTLAMVRETKGKTLEEIDILFT